MVVVVFLSPLLSAQLVGAGFLVLLATVIPVLRVHPVREVLQTSPCRGVADGDDQSGVKLVACLVSCVFFPRITSAGVTVGDCAGSSVPKLPSPSCADHSCMWCGPKDGADLLRMAAADSYASSFMRAASL